MKIERCEEEWTTCVVDGVAVGGVVGSECVRGPQRCVTAAERKTLETERLREHTRINRRSSNEKATHSL